MNITLKDYWMGRDVAYPHALTPDIEREAGRTVELVNRLLVYAALGGVALSNHPTNGSLVSSGWRPPAVNRATLRAAPNSKHMTGRALDVYDPDGDLDEWLVTDKGRAALESVGLWMEHPAATKGWSHLQSVPPGSGRRVFYP